MTTRNQKPPSSLAPYSGRGPGRGVLFFLLMSILAAGCAAPKPIFEPINPPIVWPAPPEPARIRYVGQLITSADLKPSVSALEGIGGALFGKKPARSMLTPYAACTDNRDRLFVVDTNAQVVHVFDMKTRKYERIQPTLNQLFSQPVGVAYDTINDRLIVSDSVAATVYIFSSMGGLVAQTPQGLFQRPTGVCFDAINKRIFVADTTAHRIVVIAPNGQPITTFGSRGTAVGQFNYPISVALDHANRLYVCDSLNYRIQEFSPDLQPIKAFGRKGDLPGYFGQPKGLACDSQNNLYVVDASFEAVQLFNPDGQLLLNFGEEGTKSGQFWLPAGIFIDPSDRIWIADSYNRRVQVFQLVRENQR